MGLVTVVDSVRASTQVSCVRSMEFNFISRAEYHAQCVNEPIKVLLPSPQAKTHRSSQN